MTTSADHPHTGSDAAELRLKAIAAELDAGTTTASVWNAWRDAALECCDPRGALRWLIGHLDSRGHEGLGWQAGAEVLLALGVHGDATTWFMTAARRGADGTTCMARAAVCRWRAGDLEAAWTLAQEGLPHPHAHAVLAAFSRSHGGDIPEGPLTDDPAVADIVARARRRVTTP